MSNNVDHMTRARQENAEALGDEIAWLRTFGWGDEQVARRLGVTVACLEKRDRKAKVRD